MKSLSYSNESVLFALDLGSISFSSRNMDLFCMALNKRSKVENKICERIYSVTVEKITEAKKCVAF